MITPAEIKTRALKYWESGAFLSEWCKGNVSFPLNIPFGKISGSVLSNNYSEISKEMALLINTSKAKTGSGYSIDFREVNHRQLGNQRLPERVYIESEKDFLSLCKKENEFNLFKKLFLLTERRLAKLIPFICDKPGIVLKFSKQWDNIISVCLFFIAHPKPDLYIRQIMIHGIDTKFIEVHKKIINELMTFLQPEHYVSNNSGISKKAFEKRFGLLYDEPLIRFRILDNNLLINGLADISIPASDFVSFVLPVERIFFTENKINGLCFPPVKKAIVIFGLGYGVQIINEIPWLKEKEAWYWGDIDTHGFSILSMMRHMVPLCRSFLMDEETLLAHKDCWVKESETERFTGELERLTDDEYKLFEMLKKDHFGTNIRLEQELIGYDFLLDALEC